MHFNNHIKARPCLLTEMFKKPAEEAPSIPGENTGPEASDSPREGQAINAHSQAGWKS